MKRFLVAVFLLCCGGAQAQTLIIQTPVTASGGAGCTTNCTVQTLTATGGITAGGPSTLTTLNGWGVSFGVLFASAGAPTTPGTAYVPGDTVTITGGTATTQAVLAVATTEALTGTVVSGGSGGTTGACTVTGTTGTGTMAQFSGTVSGGALTGPLTVAVAGAYNTNPTNIAAEPVTGCSLTGATVSLTTGILTFNVQSNGVYSVLPSSPVSQGSTSGSGSGATFPVSYGPLVANALFSGATATQNNMGWGTGSLGHLTSGHEDSAYGPYSCSGVTTGYEDNCFGIQSGGLQNGNYNAFFAGAGALLAGTGNGNTVGGQDSVRNATDISAMALWGGNAAHNLTGTGAGQWSGIGYSVFYNNVSQNGNNGLAGVGFNSCFGATGATFTNVGCFGAHTGGALTTANYGLILGDGIGNATYASGTGVILIGSGAQTVDTPLGSTSYYINMENILKVTGTNVPSTSAATLAGSLNVVGQIYENGSAIGGGYGGLYGASASTPQTPAVAGTGYVTGDQVTMADSCGTSAVLSVVASAGAITGYSGVVNPGSCTSIPANPVLITSTTGSGTGGEFNMVYAPLASTILTPSGSQGDLFLASTQQSTLTGVNDLFINAGAGGKLTGLSSSVTAIGLYACGGLTASAFTASNILCLGPKAASAMTTGAARDIFITSAGLTTAISGTDSIIISPSDGGAAFTSGAQDVLIDGGNTVTSGNGLVIEGYKADVTGATVSGSVILGAGSSGGANGARGGANSVIIGGSNGNTAAGNASLTGAGQDVIGSGCAQTNDTTGTNVILIGTSTACDTPSAGLSNYMGLFGSGGAIISATGTNTPSTSVTTVAGVINVVGAIQTNGTPGLASKTCIASAATLTIVNGLITATSGC